MKHKILWCGLSFLLVAALVLASCGEAVPGEQEEEEEEEEEPVVEPKLGEGMVIYAQMGGMPGLPCTDPRIRGCEDAAELYGVELIQQFGEYKSDLMVSQFKEALAARPDGIILSGIAGEDAMRPLVEEALEKGIIVTSNHIPINEFERDFKEKGYGYVGLDYYITGWAQAKNTIELAGLKEGDRVLIYGYKTIPPLAPLSIGAEDRFKEEGVIVDYIDIDAEVYTDPAFAIPILAGYFSAHPDCKAMVLWHGILTASMGELLGGAGLEPGDIFLCGCDLGSKTIEALEAGWVDAIGDQLIYLQGLLSIQQIVLTKLYGFPGLHIPTGPIFVTRENIDEIIPLIEQYLR